MYLSHCTICRSWSNGRALSSMQNHCVVGAVTGRTVIDGLLAALRAEDTDGRSAREFVRVLKLHQHYPAELVEQGVILALQYAQTIHADGVELCIRQHLNPKLKGGRRLTCPASRSLLRDRSVTTPYPICSAITVCSWEVAMDNPLLDSYLKSLRLPAFAKHYRPICRRCGVGQPGL